MTREQEDATRTRARAAAVNGRFRRAREDLAVADLVAASAPRVALRSLYFATFHATDAVFASVDLAFHSQTAFDRAFRNLLVTANAVSEEQYALFSKLHAHREMADFWETAADLPALVGKFRPQVATFIAAMAELVEQGLPEVARVACAKAQAEQRRKRRSHYD